LMCFGAFSNSKGIMKC